jgi:hypothetical protein
VSAGLDIRTPRLSPDEEFLDRFGDAIDDRIAETMDELLEQRRAASRNLRLPRILITVIPVLSALAASVFLHGSPVAWTIWPAAAVICVAGLQRAGR